MKHRNKPTEPHNPHTMFLYADRKQYSQCLLRRQGPFPEKYCKDWRTRLHRETFHNPKIERANVKSHRIPQVKRSRCPSECKHLPNSFCSSHERVPAPRCFAPSAISSRDSRRMPALARYPCNSNRDTNNDDTARSPVACPLEYFREMESYFHR